MSPFFCEHRHGRRVTGNRKNTWTSSTECKVTCNIQLCAAGGDFPVSVVIANIYLYSWHVWLEYTKAQCILTTRLYIFCVISKINSITGFKVYHFWRLVLCWGVMVTGIGAVLGTRVGLRAIVPCCLFCLKPFNYITISQIELDLVRGLQLTPQQYFPLTQLSSVTQPVVSNICL